MRAGLQPFLLGTLGLMAFAVLAPGHGCAQSPPADPDQIFDFKTTVEEEFKQRGLDTSNAGLLKLLEGPGDVWDRILAGQELARRGVKEAVPGIRKLSREPATEVAGTYAQVYLPCALATLGDPQGRAALHALCDSHDQEKQYGGVMCSIQIGDRYCLAAAIDLAAHGEDEQTRSSGVYLIGNFAKAKGVDVVKEILPPLFAALRVKPLRQAASQTIALIGEPRALPELRKAVEAEEDPELRSWMAKQLVILEQAEREKGQRQ